MPQRQAQDQARDDRDLVALEDVGRHAGAVADVVADKVGDDRRIARVILRDSRLDLPDQVSADVGGLGEDATADPHEQRQERAPEAEPEQCVWRGNPEQDEDRGPAEQAQPVGEHPGDRPGAVRDAQRISEGAARGGGHPYVGLHRHSHADLPDGQAEPGAHDERRCARQADDQPHLSLAQAGEALHGFRGGGNDVHRKEERNGEHDDEREDRAELAPQVGIRAVADGAPDLLHLGAPFVFLQDLVPQEDRVGEPQDGHTEHGPDGGLLERGESLHRVAPSLTQVGFMPTGEARQFYRPPKRVSSDEPTLAFYERAHSRLTCGRSLLYSLSRVALKPCGT